MLEDIQRSFIAACAYLFSKLVCIKACNQQHKKALHIAINLPKSVYTSPIMGACDGSQMAYLVVQEQLATLNCLVEMNRWNPGAGHALTRSIIMVSHAVKNSLQGVPNQFTATQLLQVMCMPSHSQSLHCCIHKCCSVTPGSGVTVVLRQACAQLASAHACQAMVPFIAVTKTECVIAGSGVMQQDSCDAPSMSTTGFGMPYSLRASA